jgi:hypothetical protein
MQPKSSRRTFLRATATLALGKLLALWEPRATALAQEIEPKRPEDPTQEADFDWSTDRVSSPSRVQSEGVVVLKLVVTNMATNEQSCLVLDADERYLVELSVA